MRRVEGLSGAKLRMTLQRDAVARAAIQLLDQVGLDNLTMRRLATHLRIQNPSLYWHFENKRALLNCMTEIMVSDALADLRAPQGGQDWAIWVADYARTLRRMMLAHRDGARFFAAADLMLIDPFVHRLDDAVGVLLEAGFDSRTALVSIVAILKYVLGGAFELQSNPARGLRHSSDRKAPAHPLGIDPERYPRLAGLLVAQGTPLAEAERSFEEGLGLILNGMRADLHKTAALTTSVASRRRS